MKPRKQPPPMKQLPLFSDIVPKKEYVRPLELAGPEPSLDINHYQDLSRYKKLPDAGQKAR